MLSSDFITTFLSILVVSVFSTFADSQRRTEDGLSGEEGYSSHRGQESATTPRAATMRIRGESADHRAHSSLL